MLRLHSKTGRVRSIQAKTGAVHPQRMFAAAREGDNLELTIYDAIGGDGWFNTGVTAEAIKQKLDEAGDVKSITVRINSPGGSVFEASAIYSLLTQHKAEVEVYIDGIAASAAFTIAMAGDKVHMSRAGMMMLHNSLGVCMGHSNDMRAMADVLDQVSAMMLGIYSERSGMDRKECAALMEGKNGDGTWLTPEQAVEYGFADDIVKRTDDEETQARALTAQFNLKKFGIKVQPKTEAKVEPKDEQKKDTKRVDGEDLAKSAFAYQGSDDHADWKLPIAFSSDEKSARHVRNAIARWSKTDMPNAAEKAKARNRIKAAAKKHDIELDDDSLKDEAAPPAEDATAQNDNGCDCDCAECQAGNCAGCTDGECDDAACAEAGCPNQKDDDEPNDEVDASETDVATLRAKIAILKG